jgi:hypothetical protein
LARMNFFSNFFRTFFRSFPPPPYLTSDIWYLVASSADAQS